MNTADRLDFLASTKSLEEFGIGGIRKQIGPFDVGRTRPRAALVDTVLSAGSEDGEPAVDGEAAVDAVFDPN